MFYKNTNENKSPSLSAVALQVSAEKIIAIESSIEMIRHSSQWMNIGKQFVLKTDVQNDIHEYTSLFNVLLRYILYSVDQQHSDEDLIFSWMKNSNRSAQIFICDLFVSTTAERILSGVCEMDLRRSLDSQHM